MVEVGLFLAIVGLVAVVRDNRRLRREAATRERELRVVYEGGKDRILDLCRDLQARDDRKKLLEIELRVARLNLEKEMEVER